ncbi:MAG: metallophosphoesterase [Acutalibacteraceae bacterium]
MALYAISDLHLSFGTDKPMDIFKGWAEYTEKLKNNIENTVSDSDTIVIPGDISWAMKLKDTIEDFRFINNLPGKKIIGKGNHDLWWESLTKMNRLMEENGFDTISFLHNNCFVVDDVAVCGSRGWFFDDTADKKIILREAGRVEMSVNAAKQTGKEPVLFLHYPPVSKTDVCDEIMQVILKHNIKNVYYGHIHKGGAYKAFNGEYEGVNFRCISCDIMNFEPLLIKS